MTRVDDDSNASGLTVSQGLRLPRPLLDAAGFATDAEVVVEARAGWAAAFARMAAASDDVLRDPPVETDFDRTDWQR